MDLPMRHVKAPTRRAVATCTAALLTPLSAAKAGTNYYTYDALGRLFGSQSADGTGRDYIYDAAGNRTALLANGLVGRGVTSNVFDSQFYLAIYVDVANANTDPYQHYLNFGWKEGRWPSAYFNTRGYLNAYGDVAAAGVDPLLHYNQNGWHEGRNPSSTFSTTKYLQTYPDIANAGINPLEHFLQFGYFEGRSSCGDGTYAPPT